MDEVRSYLALRSEFEEAQRNLTRLAGLIAQVNDGLTINWTQTKLRSPSIEDSSTLDDQTDADGGIDLSRWPTAEEIGTALRDVQSLFSASHQAWERIAPGDREALQPPPESEPLRGSSSAVGTGTAAAAAGHARQA